MNLRLLSVMAAGTSASLLCYSAGGAYLGLGTQLHSSLTISGAPQSVWRVYAVFDNPNDYVTALGSGPVLGPLTIKSVDAIGNPGSDFFNVGINSKLAPSQSDIVGNPAAEWDTFATIGVAIDDGTDQTFVSAGFPAFIPGNQLFNSTGIAWATAGRVEQGKAGGPNGISSSFAGVAAPITGLGVLVMQLTVTQGSYVAGTVGVKIHQSDGSDVTYAGQTFSSAVPGPAGAMIFAASALVAGCRRRQRRLN